MIRSAKRLRLCYTLLCLLLVFIWGNSLMPAEISAGFSGWIKEILDKLLPGFSTGDGETGHHLLRKLAHFSEYTAIGMLLTSCAYSFDRFKPYRYLAYVFFAGLGTAFVDETIQLLSEGRAGMITDMWIDFSGVVLGTAIMLLFYFVYQRIRRKKMKHE